MEKLRITLYQPQQAHQALMSLWPRIKAETLACNRLVLKLEPETRSTAQNSMLWACLTDIARQVDWHGQKLDQEAWKDMSTAALKRQRVVPGIDGGFVVLGQRTSSMTKAEMTELIDFLHAFGDQRGIRWSPTSLGRDAYEYEGEHA